MKNYKLLRRPLMVFLLALVSTVLWAQIPEGYYNSAEGKSGTALRTALHNIIKGHTVVSYDGLKTAYAYTDCDANMKIIDIYSNYHYGLSGDCGNYSKEGDCWNREHTWPQSWFGSGTPKSDLFQVYPTDGYVNGRRSNYPYGEVKGNASYTSTNGSKLGNCDPSLGYSGTVFEPADEYKGDIARSYFYMSTRYYTEDGSWSSSDMTNKCEIKPWAMKMLLKWSDEDPVSQKEISRNEAVYGFQGNRNPFIDHPEYAHMIWDSNWTEGTTYDITCATNLQHGSVTAPAKAAEGSTVAITALPDAGYKVNTYSAWKTGSTSTTINVSGSGTFTMPAYAVTVSATFKQDDTQYNIAIANTTHGTITASASKALSGTLITLTATPDADYVLSSLHVHKTGTSITVPVADNNTFTMPSFDVTVSATFNKPGQIAFEKVTDEQDDWSGDYLIVYEAGSVALNSALETLDVVKNTISVTMSGNTIEANDATNAAVVTITPIEGGYAIKAANGKYIGNESSSKNDLVTSDDPMLNTLSYDADNQCICIKGGKGGLMRFNTQSGQERFRYYQKGQEPVQLYRRLSQGSAIATHTITFHNGSETVTQTVNDMQPTTLKANTFTKSGFEFDGWTTEADGTGEYYEDEATVTLMEDLDLYALWDEIFTVTCLTAEGGIITASPTKAVNGTPIIITATPQANYSLQTLTATDSYDNIIFINDDGVFEMPAANVTVKAIFINATSISNAQTLHDSQSVYDLQGRRVATSNGLRKGVYLKENKKVVR